MTGPMTRKRMRSLGVRLAAAAGLLALLALGSGCATTVPVYQRERLADRIMSFQTDAKATTRRMKTFESREGSTGGSTGAGGGCACN